MLDYSDPPTTSLMVHAMTPVNRLIVLPILLKTKVDIPREERARFQRYVNRDTAAFLSPTHPMFMIDWMVDKEVCSQISPRMAHWGDAAVVNANKLGKWFWTHNGLIATNGRALAEDFSIRWASQGHGVLLHPEGIARWTASRVHEIFQGIARMPINTAKALAERSSDRPVWIVPFVSRLRFRRDVSSGLQDEMALIEQRLELPDGEGLAVADRFASLQVNLSRKRHELLEYTPPEPLTPASFFRCSEACSTALLARLEAQSGPMEGSLSQQINRHERALKQAQKSGATGLEPLRTAVYELRRIYTTSPDLYGGPELTQEQIAESLKRILREIVDNRLVETRTGKDVFRKVMPRPVGRSVIHVRLADPVRVDEAVRAGEDEAELTDKLLTETHASMQRRVDELKREVAGQGSGPVHPNPLEVSA